MRARYQSNHEHCYKLIVSAKIRTFALFLRQQFSSKHMFYILPLFYILPQAVHACLKSCKSYNNCYCNQCLNYGKICVKKYSCVITEGKAVQKNAMCGIWQ